MRSEAAEGGEGGVTGMLEDGIALRGCWLSAGSVGAQKTTRGLHLCQTPLPTSGGP
jgi:hypothetical protein